MSHSERIQEAAKEIERTSYGGYPPTWEMIAAIISKHIPEQNEWVKVTPETCPTVNKVWVWGEFLKRDTPEVVAAYFYPFATKKGGNFGPVNEGVFPKKVTHWMIPALPTLATPSEPLGVTKEKK